MKFITEVPVAETVSTQESKTADDTQKKARRSIR
jgi:hypothetical protein